MSIYLGDSRPKGRCGEGAGQGVTCLARWGAADLPGKGQAPAVYSVIGPDPFQEGRAEAAANVCPIVK